MDSKARESLLFGCVYLSLAFVNLRVKLWLTPNWFSGSLVRHHEKLVAFEGVVPENHRLLQFGIPEALSTLFSISVANAYILQRWSFFFLTFLAFHFYLRRWFLPIGAFAGVCLTAAILPLTYFNHLQESAPLLALTFLLLLWTIREKRDGLYVLLLAVSVCNNETVLCLPALYFFVNVPRIAWEERRQIGLVGAKTLLFAIPAYVIWFSIRAYAPDLEQLSPGFQPISNVNRVLRGLGAHPLDHWRTTYLYGFWFFGAIWVLAMTQWKRKPVYIRRTLLLVPIFLAFHLRFTMINEVRLLVPLTFILIPSAFFSLFGNGEANLASDPVGIEKPGDPLRSS